MKLYDCSTAPSPRRVRVFLAEKGIELDTVEVDLRNGEQFSDEFRKLNPDCAVPVLELDDGRCITEVTAICSYLEELHPEPPLFGRTPEQRALALMWNAKVEQQGLSGMMEAFRNSAKGLKDSALPGPDRYAQIPALAERGFRRVAHFFERLDDQLSKYDYVAGDFYSVADITAMVLVDFAAWLKIAIPEEAPNVSRWYAAVSVRPSTRA